MSLTAKQEKFCQEYVRTGNKSEAYRLAYDSENMLPETIHNKAYALSDKGGVRARIEELQKEVAERNKISIDELVQSMAAMVRFDVKSMYDDHGNLLPINQMPKEARLMIESFDLQEVYGDGGVVGVTKKVRTIKKLDAIEKLMKHLGGYEKDNRQKTTEVNISPIEWSSSNNNDSQ